MNANFKVVGSTRVGIKLESAASEVGALTTRPSELLDLPYPHGFANVC